jgi:Raf kinase inhibitor-like YbhB/YbcL family protein
MAATGKGARLARCGGVIGRRACGAATLLATVPLLAGCGLLGGAPALRQIEPQVMTVTSPAFGQAEIIPQEYTCHGNGDRPPIYWSGAPPGTKALALVVDDADAPITPYIYWIVLDISPTTTDIQAGPLPPGTHQADNSRGFAGYDAPCPIHGSHKYRFTIYALSSKLALGNDASAKEAWTAIARDAIARGRLTATANGLSSH